MSDAPDDFLRFLEVQRADYLRVLPGRVSDVEATWNAMAHERTGTEWEVLERQAHNLAGTAGTFGFEALSDAAKALERAVHGRDLSEITRAIALLRLSLPPDA